MNRMQYSNLKQNRQIIYTWRPKQKKHEYLQTLSKIVHKTKTAPNFLEAVGINHSKLGYVTKVGKNCA